MSQAVPIITDAEFPELLSACLVVVHEHIKILDDTVRDLEEAFRLWRERSPHASSTPENTTNGKWLVANAVVTNDDVNQPLTLMTPNPPPLLMIAHRLRDQVGRSVDTDMVCFLL